MTQANPTDHSIIKLENVSVHYRVPSIRYSTFKEFVFQRLKGKSTYTDIYALKNVSLDIARGESVALIGHNGCGKSTLLKVMAGVIEPFQATVAVKGRVAPLIELGAGFDGELSGKENIRLSCMLMGLSSEEVDERMDSIVNFSELTDFIYVPVKNYSSGMYARLGFACATAVNPDILLIDEVLSVGDSNFSRKCLKRIGELRETGTTVVFVSHDTNTLRQFCNRGFVFYEGVLRLAANINEAICFHEELMDERQLNFIEESSHKEFLRQRKLERFVRERDLNANFNLPRIDTVLRVLQDNAEVEAFDLARPFEFVVKVKAENWEAAKDDVVFGLGINTKAGVRVGGFNTSQVKVAMDRNRLAPSKDKRSEFSIRFIFARGLPEIAAATFLLEFGIHDSEMTRDLGSRHLGLVESHNSNLGPNHDKDIVSLGAEGARTIEIDYGS